MRSAIFVDAGYLYGGGFVALSGSNLPREYGELNLSEAVAKLKDTASGQIPNFSLLRIYWYDGMVGGRPSPEQEQLAYMDDVKLRLGVVRDGRQKGVDSLIVTDLIELARNRAISDAVLLAGDEDLRIGVQIAQSFGVRIHLVGLEPSRSNQSYLLLQEADTTTEWSKADIGTLLSFNPNAVQWSSASANLAQIAESAAAVLNEAVDEFVATLSDMDINIIAALSPNDPLPRNYDAPLLAASREKMGRDLEEMERRHIRSRCKAQAILQSTPAHSG